MKNKKQNVLLNLYEICEKKGDFTFDNELVKKVSAEVGFTNQFDVTKLDTKEKLPDFFIKNDIAVIHLGRGIHKFIKGINKIYHDFEPIKKNIEWKYKKSILNMANSSESNILSIANNQRILHDFLFGVDKEFDNVDILLRPKTYFPHRTKTDLEYNFGNDIVVKLKSIQIEIDLTIEYMGHVGVFEAKNGMPTNFSVYQLYHPYLYYYNLNKSGKLPKKLKKINSVYLNRQIINNETNIKLWCYKFTNPLDITTIKLVKSANYILKEET
jgi:hypothetical protein